MSTWSLVIAALGIVLSVATFSGVQAKSNNNSRSGATNHQASSGTGQSGAKTSQAPAKKKKVKPAISDITITKTKDKASPQ